MAIFAGLCLKTLVAAEGVEGTCTEGCGPREGSALLQKGTARALDLVDEEVSSEELSHGWPECWNWPQQQIDAAIAAEDDKLKVKNALAQKCLKGHDDHIFWRNKKVEYLWKCLKRRFGYGDFVEDSVSEGNTVGDGALLEEGAEAWPKCKDLTVDSGKKIVQEEQEEIEKLKTKRDTKCGKGAYWVTKKIEYLNKCKDGVIPPPSSLTSTTT